MIIGIDASRANRDHKSGTEWYSFYLIKWLAQIDDRNEYILYTDKYLNKNLCDLRFANSGSKTNFEMKINDKGGQEIKSPHNNFKVKILKWPYYFFWTLGRLSIEMLLHRPDILFVPAHTLPLVHPKRSLVTIHDVGFAREIYLYRSDKMGPENSRARKIIDYLIRTATFGKYGANTVDYQNWSTRFALKHAKMILTVSEFTKLEIKKIFGDYDRKISVVLNGYNDEIYQKIEDKEMIKKVLANYGIEQPYYFYVGRLERKKNTPQLIEAFALLKEKNKSIKHKLVLVGDASYGYDEVKYAIKEYGLDDDVIMPGWIEEKDMPYLYNGADAFIFPSLYEGFGIPLLQAMACGLPIASSQTASIPEITGDASLLFNPNNIIAMSDAMERIVSDKNLRNVLIANGYLRVKQFSWKKCAEETLRVINKL
jgi:glycosyltransferase involved in cell wall biosynthesis